MPLIGTLLALGGCSLIPPQQLISGTPGTAQTVRFDAGCQTDTLLQDTEPTRLTLNSNQFSLLNWNIYKGQRSNWESEFSELIAAQDILVLQEASLHPSLLGRLHDHAHWQMNTGFIYRQAATGVMTASSVEPVSSCGLRNAEPWIKLPKTILVNRYRLSDSDQLLLVANVHGINFTAGTEAYARQLTDLVEVVAWHDGPVIIAGDFNSWNEPRNRIVREMVKSLSLQSLSYRNHNRTSAFGHVLDHVFYRGLFPLTVSTIDVTSSDHNPIRVTFRLAASDNHLAEVRQP
jgi:endonuclease/exonuclease/phosphatase (EEP) superfamily protein YafD